MKNVFTKQEFKEMLADKTNCGIQNNGWTCGTCFFEISDKLTNQDWQSLLLYRGDYKADELDNLPPDQNESLNKIFELINNF